MMRTVVIGGGADALVAAQLLAGLDEGPRHIAVLDQAVVARQP